MYFNCKIIETLPSPDRIDLIMGPESINARIISVVRVIGSVSHVQMPRDVRLLCNRLHGVKPRAPATGDAEVIEHYHLPLSGTVIDRSRHRAGLDR